MFRVVVYIRVGLDRITLRSDPIDSPEYAERLLDQLLALPGVTGGGLETSIRLAGDQHDNWVVYEPESEE